MNNNIEDSHEYQAKTPDIDPTIKDIFEGEAEAFEEAHRETINRKQGIPNAPTLADFTGGTSERLRAWTCILYPDSWNLKELERLEKQGFQGALSPLHDKDVFLDGRPKKPHHHLVLHFAGKKSKKQVLEIVEKLNGALATVQPVVNLPGMIRYLAHLDIDPERKPSDIGKVKYDPNGIVSFGGLDVRALMNTTTSERDKVAGILCDYVLQNNVRHMSKIARWIRNEHIQYWTYFLHGDVQRMLSNLCMGIQGEQRDEYGLYEESRIEERSANINIKLNNQGDKK